MLSHHAAEPVSFLVCPHSRGAVTGQGRFLERTPDGILSSARSRRSALAMFSWL